MEWHGPQEKEDWDNSLHFGQAVYNHEEAKGVVQKISGAIDSMQNGCNPPCFFFKWEVEKVL